uniref:Uncharacterized protein n=1 Tax=Vespula pensylvanica TaxID=30213 RepID=A0A834UAH2_VESPE|nr:hypothetical protein H0235_008150 [Vespula pensylvanica]
MSQVTFSLLVIALIMCIIVQTIWAAPTLQENEEGHLAGCGHQAAHVKNCLKNKMAKLLLLVCFALLTLTYVMACLQPGVPCSNSDQCCGLLVCNPWANRCTKGGNWPLADANSGGKQ